MADSPRKTRTAQLVALLAPTLGQEKSESLVATSARKLGFPWGDELHAEQAAQIVDDLARIEGIVGVVARFIRARGELDLGPDDEKTKLVARLAPAAGMPASRPSSPGDGLQGRFSPSDLNAFLAPALGDEKGLEAIAQYAVKIGATGEHLTRAQAMEMLEQMAQAQGVLGTVARFAKARFILKYPA